MTPLLLAVALAGPADIVMPAPEPGLAGEPSGRGVGGGTPIRWERNFQDALRKAQALRKPLLVDFWADWCGWCHRLDETTYVDPTVVRLSADFVPVKVDEGTSRGAAVAHRYDVTTLPTIFFLSPHGRPLLRINGFQGPGQFPRTMEAALDVARRVMAWENTLDLRPGDPAALAGLGAHLFEQDAYPESAELLARASTRDDGRPLEERKQTRMLLGAILKANKKNAEAEKALKAALELPAHPLDAKVLYVLGKTYLAWGRTAEGRAVLQRLVAEHGQAPIAHKARETLVALDKK